MAYFFKDSVIIPTRVGTRSEKHFLTPKATDHPHACGDKFSFLRTDNLRQGSSPRVWGQVGGFMNDFIKNRIIPTRVGTSFSIFGIPVLL